MIKTSISGLYIINQKKITDNRGQFIKFFSKDFVKGSINTNFKECYFTISKRNVLRGIHYQNKKGCDKLIFVIKGNILDVVIDLRKKSKTYKKIFFTKLSQNEKKSVYIPAGCGHAYKVLSKDAIVGYLTTKQFSKIKEKEFLWSSIKFNWKIKNPILSKKDKNAPSLNLE
tara:strand:- start:2 stop:514 length:513 start_codon:yes stop_codon:yes gene_type:complete